MTSPHHVASGGAWDSVLLWIRSEVFDYGLFPIPPRSKISYLSLLDLVKKYNFIHDMNDRYYTAVNSLFIEEEQNIEAVRQLSFVEWQTVGSEDLHLNDNQIKYYFDRFCCLRDIKVGHKKRTPGESSVNFYEFVLYLYCQLIGKIGFTSHYARGTQWTQDIASPNPKPAKQPLTKTHSPPGPTKSKRVNAKPKDKSEPTPPSPSRRLAPPMNIKHLPSRISVTLHEQLHFVKDHIPLMLRLLLGSTTKSAISSKALEPLNFLFGLGVNFNTRLECSIIDVIPDKAGTREFSLEGLAAWISDHLHVNTFLYDPYTEQFDFDIPVLRPGSVILDQPFSILGVHSRTMLKTDKESIPGAIPTRPRGESLAGLNSTHTPGSLASTGHIVSASSLLTSGSSSPLSNAYMTPSTSSASLGPSISSHSLPSRGSSAPPVMLDTMYQDARVSNCSALFLYVLRPMGHVRISECIDCTIVLGAVGGILDVRDCKRTKIIAACHAVQAANNEDCDFFLLTNTKPILLGSNHGLFFGPFNTHYRSLHRHLREARIFPFANYWCEPIICALDALKDFPAPGLLSPFRSPIRADPEKIEMETFSIIPPEEFVPFRVPFDLVGDTKSNPYELEPAYQYALEAHAEEALELKRFIESQKYDRSTKEKFKSIIKESFEDWLRASGNMQQLEDLAKLQVE